MDRFTCAVFIVDNEIVLMIFHRNLQRWLPPGGKVENGELPQDAARREVKEEVGLDIELHNSVDLDFSQEGVEVLIQPHHMQLETMPDGSKNCDFIFHCKPTNLDVVLDEQTAEQYRWMNKNDLETYVNEWEVRQNAKMSIDNINSRITDN